MPGTLRPETNYKPDRPYLTIDRFPNWNPWAPVPQNNQTIPNQDNIIPLCQGCGLRHRREDGLDAGLRPAELKRKTPEEATGRHFRPAQDPPAALRWQQAWRQSAHLRSDQKGQGIEY